MSIAISSRKIAEAFDPATVPREEVHGLYVHIPFCFHKCHYCDFYSITRQTPERMERFVDLILREAEDWAKRLRPKPRTAFFGGGTPTLLPLESMRRLIERLNSIIDLSACNEWTVEANPATVNLEYCQMLRDTGITRMSFGAQSFAKSELAMLERHHEPVDVKRSLELARAAGFSRLNLDLIYAIPGQTMGSWMSSLESALALGTDHVSCYGLTYEPNTPMAVRKRLGQFKAAEDELEIAMMHATRRRLADAGLDAYEISNYSRPGEECRHNLMYWHGENYIGLGPSAASHVAGHRWKNRGHLGEWESASQSGQPTAVEVEIHSPTQRAGELAMLTLRLSAGLNFADFAARTGFDARAMFAEPVERFVASGHLRFTDGGVAISDLGLSVADHIAGEFLTAADCFTR